MRKTKVWVLDNLISIAGWLLLSSFRGWKSCMHTHTCAYNIMCVHIFNIYISIFISNKILISNSYLYFQSIASGFILVAHFHICNSLLQQWEAGLPLSSTHLLIWPVLLCVMSNPLPPRASHPHIEWMLCAGLPCSAKGREEKEQDYILKYSWDYW